jgi:hypothetical protein
MTVILTTMAVLRFGPATNAQATLDQDRDSADHDDFSVHDLSICRW